MSELVFKRPSRVEIQISKSEGGFIYVTVWQISKGLAKHLATANGIPPERCRLIDQGEDWVLDLNDCATRFHLKPAEGRKVHEQFGFAVSQLRKAA